MSEAQQYCLNIAPTAADARYAWEAKRLADLSEQLKQRIAELDAKQAEYKSWVTRREELMKKAQETLVGIYAHMQPEAAASQLAAMDDDTAAAVLAQLAPRAASAILDEMEPGRAARLAGAIAGGQAPGGGKKS